MFNTEKFIEFICDEFPVVFTGNYGWCREWLENLVKWVTETYDGKKDTIIATLDSILPEVTEEEIEKFWEK